MNIMATLAAKGLPPARDRPGAKGAGIQYSENNGEIMTRRPKNKNKQRTLNTFAESLYGML